MDNVQTALNKLEADRINNISMINFLKNNRMLSIDIIDNSVLARGISDRRWVYISCPGIDELRVLKNLLSTDDLNFAAIDSWMIPILTSGKKVIWNLSAIQYYLADDIQLSSPDHKTFPLTERDAEMVYNNSEYKEYISLEYVVERIRKGISVGIYDGNQLVAWAITQDDGAMGFLHTLDNYRKKGYAYSISLSMIEKLRSVGELPFAYVVPSNIKSISLLMKIGFLKNKSVHWFEIG